MNVTSASGSTVHLIAVRNGQRFSLPVSTVSEVLPMPELELVPLAPPEMLGSFQLRGEIIPAVLPDLVLAVGSTETAPSVLALLREGDAAIALAFDKVLGVVSIDASSLLPHPLAAQRPWMTNLRIDPRYQLVTVLAGPALVAALVDQMHFSLSTS